MLGRGIKAAVLLWFSFVFMVVVALLAGPAVVVGLIVLLWAVVLVGAVWWRLVG